MPAAPPAARHTLETLAMQTPARCIPFLVAAILAGAASAAEDYITNAADIVKQADWQKMQTVTVTIEDHHYTPEHLVFKAGQPYKLELKNLGEKDHYFTAAEFYRSVATRKAMVNKQAEIKAPYFTALEILKNGGQIDLYFVPVKTGRFPVFCTIDDHREKGMEGSITVE